MSATPSALPSDACLVHIGPYKTGSTAIQAALWEAREQLPAHGVRYPGRTKRAMRPVWAALERKPRGHEPPRPEEWREFAEEVRALDTSRVCVSSEDLGRATKEQAHRVVTDLGDDRVYVVTVARRLDKLLPSQWQERVKHFELRSYEEWLAVVLGDDPSAGAHQRFWESHDLGAVIETWAAAVGRERLVVIVLDESDRSLLPNTFEALLGLPQGFLKAPAGVNTSLNLNGAELVRRVNAVFKQRRWPDRLHRDVIQRGLVPALRHAETTAHDRPIPAMPPWAVDRIRAITEERIALLRDPALRVIGDPESLRLPDRVDEAPGTTDAVSLDMSVQAVVGVVEKMLAEQQAADRRRRRRRRQARQARQTRRAGQARQAGRAGRTERGGPAVQPTTPRSGDAQTGAAKARRAAGALAGRVRRRLRRSRTGSAR